MTIARLAILFGGALLAVTPRLATAQDAAAAVACDPAGGSLTIYYTPSLAGADPKWPADSQLVEFWSLLILDKSKSTVRGSRSWSFVCQLRNDRFEVTLEPSVPNLNLLGRCGGALSGMVTVVRNGTALVEQQEFEALNCHERERMLESVTFRNGSPTPEFFWVEY